MAVFGMDIAEVRTLATQLDAGSTEIHNLVAKLTGLLHGTHWIGPDQQKFESDWQSQHVAALNNVATALHDASALAKQNAQQQEDASGS